MKKLLTLAVFASATLVASAQGIFNGNTATPDFQYKIFDGGVAAAGSAYDAQYYIGSAGISDPSQLSPVGSVGNPSSGGFAGFFQAGSITTPFAGGSTITVQLRAWNSAAGSTYEAALATPGAHVGTSAIIQVANLSTGVATPPEVVGLGNINLVAGPEPATIALGLMGAGAFFVRRRKV